MNLTFLKKIKNVIVAACDKLDTLEATLQRQQSIISNLQTQVEQMKTNQGDSTVLLEEILFTVSQSSDVKNHIGSKEPHISDVSISENAILENLVQNKPQNELN